MTTQWRLETKSPPTAVAFRMATSEQQITAAKVACEIATSEAALDNREVRQALEVLRAGSPAHPTLAARLNQLSSTLDDEYFRLQEEADNDDDESKKLESLRLFSQARAVSSLAFALGSDSGRYHEAIYEAMSSVEEPDEIARAVENVLRGVAEP